MKKKSVFTIVIALAMFFTVFAVNAPEAEAASSPQYWLKVNTKANVVTAYKKVKGKYVPYRAMVCSTGTGQNPTPLGTSRLGSKYRWAKLMGDVWGQYCTVIKGDYLFHSVWYHSRSKNTMSVAEYNKLGTNCSHGCVRLSTMDAKWIYENCKKGTKITVYRSSKAGPLGKPKPLKMKGWERWDPTDPSSANPNFRMKKPVITISKKKARTVQYGRKYSLKAGVTAKNVNAYQSLTSQVKVSSVKKYNSSKKKYVKAAFSTKKLGTYKITYKVYDKYCRKTAYKTIKVRVVDTLAPVITAAGRSVTIGDANAKNAVKGVTAKQKTRSRTSAIVVYIKAPGAKGYRKYSYQSAKSYVFNKEGRYTIVYKVKNCYKPYRQRSKKIYVNCKKPAALETPQTDSVQQEQSNAL